MAWPSKNVSAERGACAAFKTCAVQNACAAKYYLTTYHELAIIGKFPQNFQSSFASSKTNTRFPSQAPSWNIIVHFLGRPISQSLSLGSEIWSRTWKIGSRNRKIGLWNSWTSKSSESHLLNDVYHSPLQCSPLPQISTFLHGKVLLKF